MDLLIAIVTYHLAESKVLGMLLISLVVIAISQPLNINLPAVTLALDAEPGVATNADQARWDAKGDFYIKATSVRSEEANAADQARWDAKGDFYIKATSIRSDKAIAADQARWDAKGDLYAKAASVRSDKAIAADQARWNAIAEFYQNQGLVIDTR